MIRVNNIVITPTFFPDKTSQVWKLPRELTSGGAFKITWDFENEGELMGVLQLRSLLVTTAQSQGRTVFVELYMPFLPYGRQDKDVHNQSTFALHTFMDAVVDGRFQLLSSFDPHSDVATTYGLEAIMPWEEIAAAYVATGATKLCFPDAGAEAKYGRAGKAGPLGHLPFLSARKVRDQSTGKILSYEPNSGHLSRGDVILIVDDICDGGATFVLLAQSLLRNGADTVHLYVSHGLFTKGTEVLREAGINRIFTRNGEIA